MRRWKYEDWVEFHKSPGGRSTVMSPSWLVRGCALCGHKEWTITNDCWAYCEGCSKGYSTDYPFTNRTIAWLDEKGIVCSWCKGTGQDREDPSRPCDDCEGIAYR